MCNNSISKKTNDDELNSLVIEGTNQFNYLKKMTQKPDETIFQLLQTYQPYDNEEILNLVKERVKNDKSK